LTVKTLHREKIKSEIGLATRSGVALPLLKHLMATARQVGRRQS
jgi:hypothetical protein